MNKIKLGVNIDHVATVRNARGEIYPGPLRAALLAQKFGADSVTIHLREDRRHIKESDLKLIKSRLRIPLNLEIAATNEMIKIAIKFDHQKTLSIKLLASNDLHTSKMQKCRKPLALWHACRQK